jgi:hypothetical protein
MATEGLERLGYFNGQRLEATDLRLEQRYHIDVRRLLNRGLFTPGVVSGLEVEKIVYAGGSVEGRKVRVKRGVALDPLGREIVLREDAIVDVPNQPSTTGIGYFLIARYSEELVAGGDPWCGGTNGPPRPGRVREEPVLEWSEDVPTHERCQKGTEGIDCGVLLALVVLNASCELDHIQIGVREYARPTHVSQVQAFSFEGEKDIDKDNPKTLNFRILGGSPASVSLYLWGDKFSSLYYTELGGHEHRLSSLTLVESVASFPDHKHQLPAHTHRPQGSPTTDDADAGHRHSIRTSPRSTTSFDFGVTTIELPHPEIPTSSVDSPEYHRFGFVDKTLTRPAAGLGEDSGFLGLDGKQHKHPFTFQLTDAVDANGQPTLTQTDGLTAPIPASSHTHTLAAPVDVSTVGSDVRARSGNAHTYLEDLKVELDDTDITQLILDHYVPQSWQTLGNGQKEHPLNDRDGTGQIDLLAIAAEVGVDLSTDITHQLRFGVANGGGKVLYNLYVA